MSDQPTIRELELEAEDLERQARNHEADARDSKTGSNWECEFDYRDRCYDKARSATEQARRIRERIAEMRASHSENPPSNGGGA
jgi:hypothetical protein